MTSALFTSAIIGKASTNIFYNNKTAFFINITEIIGLLYHVKMGSPNKCLKIKRDINKSHLCV
uniref:Uncharacterized protein n=1 Tax=Lepeophtheirus salmonis TaxID=72036 RepID=A0A0K2VBR9_LEPSM